MGGADYPSPSLPPGPSCVYRAEKTRKMADLVIPLHELDTLGKDYSFVLSASWLDKMLEGTGIHGDTSERPGEVQVHAQRNGREILVHGRAKARLIAECGRCLKGLPLDIEADVGTLYAPADTAHAPRASQCDDDDLSIEDADREVYTGDKVEIDDLVRDSLLLELPMQPRCEQGWACPNIDLPEHLRAAEGVSTKGFGEGHVDPRLLPLKKLAKGEPDKE